MTFPQVRLHGGDRLINDLIRQMNGKVRSDGKVCPFCTTAMKRVYLKPSPLEFDGCKSCQVVWFDGGEFEQVPESPPASVDELILRGRQVMAEEKVKQIAREAEAEDEEPDAKWKYVPGIFGLPAEVNTVPLRRRPWITWSMALVITLVSVAAFFNLDVAVKTFGLVPIHAWRWGGITFLTAFFLHGGIWHLLSNLYFFLVFGDDVEDFLGRWRFALLLALASVSGDVLHILAEPRGDLPSIGASGGISGILAFYAFKFPRAKLGVFFRFHWVCFPAWAAFVLWIVLQGITVVQQVAGFGEVSALAHLGGVAVGILFWLKWRNE